MPLLSVSNGTVRELFNGSAKFGRPSNKAGAGWIVTAGKGNAIIQEQTINDESTSANSSAVVVVRWTNYLKADGMNGRILLGLPIRRQHDTVYFKTSSTTTLGGNRHKAPFFFKFETVDEAEEFEALWLLKNGSIASWKADNKAKKKAGSNSINLPLQETTNAVSTPARKKRKAVPMIDDRPLRKKKLVCINDGIDRSNDVENQSVFLRHDGIADDSVGAFKALGLMPTEVNINGKVRKIVKVKRSALKSIEETSTLTNLNLNEDEDGIDLKDDDNSNDLNEDDKDQSNEGSTEGIIVDEEDAPQSQNWKTAFAPY